MSSGQAVSDRGRRHIARALRSYEIPREQLAYFVRTCGEEPWADAGSVTRYCPMCGAEVVDG